MSRQYIKLDPDLPDRKDYYPDGAFRALVTVFCTASHQPRAGFFRSERLLKALLGKGSKWIGFLIAERDLERLPDDSYHVVGWEAWQEGKYPSVEARMEAIRYRRRPQTPAERAFAYRQRRKSEADAAVSGGLVAKLVPNSDDVERDASRDERDGVWPASRNRAQNGVTPRDDRHETETANVTLSRDASSDTLRNQTIPNHAGPAGVTTDQDREGKTTVFSDLVQRPRLVPRPA